MALWVLTLAKLVVFDPDLVPVLTNGYDQVLTAAQARQLMLNLLCYYKCVDEDAALALRVFQRVGWPAFRRGDFKPSWGLFAPPLTLPIVTVWPSSVTPTQEDIREIEAALLEGRAPSPPSTTTPSWSPWQVPRGYVYLPNLAQTFHGPNVGEVVSGFCVPTAEELRRVNGNPGRVLMLPSLWLSKAIRREWAEQIPSVDLQGGVANTITVGAKLTPDDVGLVRKFLESGVFPVYPLSKLDPSRYREWKAAQQAAQQETRPDRERSRVIKEA